MILTRDWKWKSGPYGYPLAPKLPACNHAIRGQIFAHILQYSTIGYHRWKLLKGEHPDWDKPQGRALQELKIGVSQLLWVRNAILTYIGIAQQCIQCPGEARGPVFHSFDSASGGPYLDTSSSMEDIFASSDAEDQQERNPEKYKCRGGTKLAGVKQTHIPPSVEPLPLPEQTLQPVSVPAPHSHNYDDYYSAPLHSTSSPAIPGIWTFDNTGTSIIPEVWASWRDRGYRLHPLFFLAITSDHPTSHQSHLLPFSGDPQITKDNPIVQDDVDSHAYSLRKLLDEAGPIEHTVESKSVLVCGRDRAGHFIRLDLEEDKVDIPLDQVKISPDIDSFTWITDSFSANSMDLHLNVSIRAKPPFSVDNFIIVSLVQPPVDEEQKFDHQQRARDNFKLSQIPHMEFGHSGQDHRRVNFIVFFPRMTWKNSTTKRFQTLIPKEVQDLWISEVVIPAIRKVFDHDAGIMEYIPGSLQELHWRTGGRKQHSTTLTTPGSITSLIGHMKDQVAQNSALLGRYGSFFFAADARGVKVVTKQSFKDQTQPELANIYDDFVDLQWPHMLDRSKGELYLDLGLSFHGNGDVPVVGLWKLDKLDDSYGLMGMKKGQVHHFSTLGMYGGRKAAMKKERQQVVHLVSRISYNLAFELVRNPATEDYICRDIEAVKYSDKFMTGCQSWLHLFQEGTQRSFGVRDEVRGTAAAIEDLLKVASVKV